MNQDLIEFDKYTDQLTEYVYALKDRADESALEIFSKMRNMPIDIVKKSDMFYIKDATEMLIPSYLETVEDFGVISPTNKKPIFHNRYVMPIKDTDGRILNLVGYSKEANERYVYGTARYYRRRETMYGLENLESAYDKGFAILTEGITDTIRIRSLGYDNCFATCGTHRSDFIMKQLNRCRYGVIKLPDRDAPGQKALRGWITYRGITLYVPVMFKDPDEFCRESEENCEITKSYIEEAIKWLKLTEHKGITTANEIVTM